MTRSPLKTFYLLLHFRFTRQAYTMSALYSTMTSMWWYCHYQPQAYRT